MAIILRNGLMVNFDPAKLRVAELAFVTDTKKLYLGVGDSQAEEVMLQKNMDTEKAERQAADEELQNNIDALRSAIGSPLVASTAAEMTDTNRVYVYVGSETGYANGHWYYYNGTAWADGGVYNAVAFETDKELDTADMAADAKATGDAINGLRGDVAELQESLDAKAEIDGYYDEMTVGSAEQLLSSDYIVDKVPYNFRTSGGSLDIGNREIDKIVGGSIVWNQWLSNTKLPEDSALYSSDTFTQNNVTLAKNSNGGYTISTTEEGASARVQLKIGSSSLLPNFTNNGHIFYFTINGRTDDIFFNFVSADYKKIPYIYKRSSSSGFNMWLIVEAGAIITTPIEVYPLLIDITQMFGATIAQHIYTLEKATTGAGVAYFKKFFPKDYYPFNKGELMSVRTAAHVMTGFNQFDENAEGEIIGNYRVFKIPIGETNLLWMTLEEKSSSVELTTENIGFCKDPSHMGSKYRWVMRNGVYTPNDAYNVKPVSSTDYYSYVVVYPSDINTLNRIKQKYNINVNLSWSGWRNGEYEPYVKHTYPLSDLELKGVPLLDANGDIYYNGDTYESDGTVTRKAVTVVLNGSENWIQSRTPDESAVSRFFRYNIGDLGSVIDQAYSCDKYPIKVAISDSDIGSNVYNSPTYKTAMIVIRPANSPTMTVAEFKALLAANPVTVTYLLTTPTIETADPYTNPQIVDAFGTEEYVDTRDVPIPVGHETEYMPNLRDKLQHLPNLADSDGYYVIQQTGHQMELVHFRIPQAPSTDGEYTLKATVSGGTPTYTWEATEAAATTETEA